MVTPIATHILDPHATSDIGDGTYFNLTAVTLFEVTVASQGEDERKFFIPPMTQRSSVVQARVKIEPCSDTTLDHERPKLSLRTIRHPVESFASPRHFFPAQFKDVSTDHVTVEKPVRGDHVAPPSWVTYTAMSLEELSKLAMHLSLEGHESAVTKSCDGTPKATGADHVVPPSVVVRNLGPLFEDSRIAHVIDV